MSVTTADEYLTIPADYWGGASARPRWSHGCDAVEAEDGSAIALAVQLHVILEGVFAAPPVPPFSFVLDLLQIFKHGTTTPGDPVELDRLQEAYSAAPKANARNAGLLIAELCRGAPPVPSPPDWSELQLALKRREVFGERRRREWDEVPPLSQREFRKHIAERLRQFDDATLRHWLGYGGPPTGGGDALAEAAVSFPQRVADLLGVLRTRERLVGALSLVPALDAALTFPARRPQPDRLPQGGYADVTTRGEPERLLPSQFALDPDEFVRRFAERELLYFRREEPHKPTPPERWLVLDQGVRTWGVVRHGLTAGVVALLAKDPDRHGVTRLRLTSAPEPVDLLAADAKELADRLERSDLTANPAEALRETIDDSDAEAPPGPRDFLLFTQRRNLSEDEVRLAVHTLRPADRLFAMTLDDPGHAELSEWATGGWVSLRKFRVDLVAAEAARVTEKPKPAPRAIPNAAWTGSVEPVPFPFRAGTLTELSHVIGFDADNEWVVAVGRSGVVHAKKLGDPSAAEVLPRAYIGGDPLTRVEVVLGVKGGVVLGGRMLFKQQEMFATAHYDFASRSVRFYFLGEQRGASPATWHIFPDLNCVAVVQPGGISGDDRHGCAVDLDTGRGFPSHKHPEGIVSRAQLAWERTVTKLASPLPLPCVNSVDAAMSEGRPAIRVGSVGKVFVYRSQRPWNSLAPLVQGEPLFKDAELLRAELAGDVLAVVMRRGRNAAKLYLLRGPDGAILHEFWPASAGSHFRLSADGSLLARQLSAWELDVIRTEPGGGPVGALTPGGFHTRLQMSLSANELAVRVGRYQHVFTLNTQVFLHARAVTGQETPATHRPAGFGATCIAYDQQRFQSPVEAGPWIAAFDTWGQVVLLNSRGRLVLTIAVRRDLVAAWMPDGTRWGAVALLGAAAHPKAAERIGQALQAAAEGREWKSPSD